MLDGLREQLNKRPALGWGVAGVLLVVMGAVMWWRLSGGGDPYAPERMTEEVTIKFTDTGDEITMPRGRMEQELRYRTGQIDPSQGIINPKTNQPTGFLFSKSDWDKTVERLNEEKKLAAARAGGATDAGGSKK